jgi:hypothetical protein
LVSGAFHRIFAYLAPRYFFSSLAAKREEDLQRLMRSDFVAERQEAEAKLPALYTEKVRMAEAMTVCTFH